MTTRRPAEAFPPGEFLREELDARGWSQTDLAEILDRPVRLVNELIAGKRGVSPETALGLAAALDTSPEFWMNLEAAYQLARSHHEAGNPIARRARLFSLAPIKEMGRRGWIESTTSLDVLEKRVMELLELQSIDDEPQFLPHAARKALYGSTTPAQRAWLFRARHLARALQAQAFSDGSVEQAVQRLRLLLEAPQDARHVARVLGETGIRFFVVQPLPGTHIDGACFWLNDTSPVVVLSLRYNRIDNFWWVLMHELGHVRMRDGLSLDLDMEKAPSDGDRPEREARADAFASEQLVPQDRFRQWCARVRPLYSAQKIEGFAKTINVHPGLVVGQLQHQHQIGWDSFRTMLVPVRDWVTPSCLTDGWGALVPAGM